MTKIINIRENPSQCLKGGEAAGARPVGLVRVALIGCGAISAQMHLPILAGHEGVRLVALVDRDVKRAGDFARGYGVARVLADIEELGQGEFDAVIIATPPFHHAPCAIKLMQSGVHVLVEKPMATNYDDAVAMVRTAQEHGVALAVGFFRRLLPSVRLLKGLLDSEWLGRPVRFEAEGGGFYTWGAATLGNMRKEMAGGGALIDYGSHQLDLLHYLFEPGELLEYRDNSLGGIEADCEMRLRLFHQGKPVEGSLAVARTRKLGNFIRVHCERGTLDFEFTERYRVRVRLNQVDLTDSFDGKSRDLDLRAGWADEKDTSWYETVRTEIDDWLGAIRTGGQPRLSGESSLPTVKIIDECYRRRQPLEEPWVFEGVTEKSEPKANPRRILVTGATGFIGSRVAEILSLREGCQVRALVHNPGSAARLARLPVELVLGELTVQADVERLVRDCDAVVHCAIGTEWGDRRKIFEVTVEGTRKLGQAALAAGVSRFVHVSTMSVHGDDGAITGVLDENSPVCPAKGSDYGESKAAAENVIQELVAQGLSATIFRPARVYGPFSRIFITRPLETLADGRFQIFGDADVPANMVYVDNLVHAMCLALRAPDQAVKGQAFLMCDPDEMTWREFYDFFAGRLGLPSPPVVARKLSDRGEPSKLASLAFWRWPGAWYSGCKNVLTAAEFKAFGRKVLQTDPLGTFPRWILKRVPGCESLARRIVGANDTLPIYHRPAPAAPADIAEMGSAGVRINIDKACQALGYRPIVTRERALELTLEWVQHARLVG